MATARQISETAMIARVMKNSLVALTAGRPVPAAAPRSAAELPDDRGEREDDQARDDVGLEHRAADGAETDRGPRPGQRRALVRQAGVRFLRVVGWLSLSLALAGRPGHRTAEMSSTTAAMIAIRVTVAARIHGSTDLGIGSPRRSACWLRTHSV